jgi:putative endonuclease
MEMQSSFWERTVRRAFAFDVGQDRQWLAMEWVAQIRVGAVERMLAGLDSLAARRGRKSTLPAHLLTGVEGEEAAFFYLCRKGYTVVARRWSAGNLPGDLDLIAWQGQVLCVIEVKTRTAHDATPAEAAIDPHKRNTLRRLARQYVRQLLLESAPQVRFDVISVYLVPGMKHDFMHFENAFGWDERLRGL